MADQVIAGKLKRGEDLTGKTFGRLRVSGFAGHLRRRGFSFNVWICVCACGRTVHIPTVRLKTGSTKSCGCYRKETVAARQKTHGMSRSSGAFKSWMYARRRCCNPKSSDWKHYGAMGIKMCERWMVFENFFSDMGERPQGFTLERKDVFGNYEPNNCCWIPMSEQAKNKRNSLKNRFKTKEEYNGK